MGHHNEVGVGGALLAAFLVCSALLTGCSPGVTVTADHGTTGATADVDLSATTTSPGNESTSAVSNDAISPVPDRLTTPDSTTSEPARSRLVVNGVGDTNLDPGYIPAFATDGYELAFTGLQGAFANDDLTIVNLECAAAADGVGVRVAKAFNFNCDTDALPVMADAGVEVANLANNHSGDYGPDALSATRANVARAGIAPVGVGADASEATEPALFEINGWKVAVVGFGGVVPAAGWLAGDDHPGMADGDDIDSMVAAVEAADEVADLVFVSIHWGIELDLQPQHDDVVRAHAMIDAGADAIFGHHPHRLQPLELYRGKPIAWSLGNFVWPRLSAAGATSAIAQVIVEPDGSITACLIPVDIESNGHPVVQVELTGPCQWQGQEVPSGNDQPDDEDQATPAAPTSPVR